VQGKANGRFAVAWTNLNEQQVWFGVDSAPPDGKVYYNRRYRAYDGAPWYWQYSTSVTTSITATRPPDRTRSCTTPACDGKTIGFLYVSFSNNGTCWTPLRQATRAGGPSLPCLPGAANTVPVETVSAIDSGMQIYLMGIEGDTTPLLDPAQMNRTQTYIGTATYTNPDVLNLIGSAEVSANGIVSPSGVTSGDIERYRPTTTS
jgi:hypothetical protein